MQSVHITEKKMVELSSPPLRDEKPRALLLENTDERTLQSPNIVAFTYHRQHWQTYQPVTLARFGVTAMHA